MSVKRQKQTSRLLIGEAKIHLVMVCDRAALRPLIPAFSNGERDIESLWQTKM